MPIDAEAKSRFMGTPGPTLTGDSAIRN
jgi:hypothetical protein